MLWLFVVAIVMPITIGTCDTNLTAIEWSHATNNQDRLKGALDNKNIRAIEADVVMGCLIEAKQASSVEAIKDETKKDDCKPGLVMAHDVGAKSDLSFDQFLNDIKEHNAKNANFSKAAKLDFKQIEAVNEAVNRMEKDWEAKYMNIPVWLNADILDGPGENLPKLVNAKEFFTAAKKLKKPTLSLGWTTPAKVKGGSYTKEHVDAMIKTIDENKIDATFPITFAIRAILAMESTENLKLLRDTVSKDGRETTFTVWTADKDVVDGAKLGEIIKSLGVDKVYVDVPEDLRKNLNLGGKDGDKGKDDKDKDGSGASTLVHFGVFNMFAVGFALFFKNGLH